ncbi:FAD-linked sulfhydryl oxidase ALR [Dermacentor andersoni]|uniref:FAD-linked sulfhydryl oxidase ALR n=1 Tax=Dermacentor andersoni TaxID=34620 RepID=UPI0021551244|nr:FAD-linked sulfhydryl oxidase ALR-like [Dermacentor andersoni]
MAAPSRSKESYDEDFDYHGDRRKKPCRACSDFKAWAKSKGGSTSKEAGPTQAGGLTVPDRECPPDRSELGRCTWSLLHSVAAYYPSRPSAEQQRDADQFFRLFSRLYPCKDCAEDFRAELASSPPRVSSRAELAQWLCEQHNAVNRKLGKPEFDCSRVDERWRRGWDDGSCS